MQYSFYIGSSIPRTLKLKACILFLCLLVYLAELAALPSYCIPVQEDVTACSTESQCCTGSCQKPREGQKDDTSESQGDCYLNCPLCYVVTLTSITLPDKNTGVIEHEYSLFRSDYVFIFSSGAWKPPNVA